MRSIFFSLNVSRGLSIILITCILSNIFPFSEFLVKKVQAEGEIAIWSIEDLDDMRNNLSGHYVLMRDLDFCDEDSYDSPHSGSIQITNLCKDLANGGLGWEPVGRNWTIGAFTGIFDGNNNKILRLYINNNDFDQYTYAHCGFWGVSDSAEIKNLNIYDSFVSCNGRLVGTLIGYSWYTTVNAINIEGVVYGESSTGGIIGETGHTNIAKSSFTGNLKADFQAGGLVGYLWASVLSESYADINIDIMDWSFYSQRYQVGGLVGYVEWSTVENSFVTGTVRGISFLGGLAGTVLTDEGYLPIAHINNCWSDVEVIRAGSSTSDVIGSLIGENHKSPVTNSYAVGRVVYEDSSNPIDKGFIGLQDTNGDWMDGNNFFDMEVSLQISTTGNATGKTTVDMKNFLTYTDTSTLGLDNPWDMLKYEDFTPDTPNAIWFIRDGEDYPKLYWQVYKVDNLNTGLSLIDTETNREVDSTSGQVNDSTMLGRVMYKGYVLSDIEVDMTTNRDWSGVTGSIDPVNGKSVVSGLTSAPGAASTHTLYIPLPSIGDSNVVRICPDATDMNGITRDCTNGVNFMEGQTKTVGSDSVTVTKSTVGGKQYWLADGVSGTGGMSLFSSFNLKDTLSRLEVDALSNHTIEFGSVNGLETSGDTIELAFDPSGQGWDLSAITVSDIEMDADGTPLTLAATPGADIWGVDINDVSDTITFTAPTSGTSYIEAGTPLIVRIGDHTTSGINQITNPTTVGEYEIHITNTYSAGGGGVETGEVEIPIIDDDTVNVHGYIDTMMTFDIDTATTDTDCDAIGGATPCNSHGGIVDAAGYVVSLGEMSLDYVSRSGVEALHADGSTGLINYIYFNLETNANSGAVVTVFSENGGLYKDATNIIPSVDMGGARELLAGSGRYGLNHRAGFINSASIGSILVDGYCNASDIQYCSPGTGSSLPLTVFSTSGPLSGGRVQFSVGASPTGTTATGTYTDQLRFIATASF